MRGLIDNSVNIGGDQVITGVKSFMQSNIDVNNIPDTGLLTGTGIKFVDKNKIEIGHIEPRQSPIAIELATYSKYGETTCSSSNRTNYDEKRSVFCSASSDENNTLLNTVAKNKAQNGYFKLGNGLIIQWGYKSEFGTDTVVTLPTPFSNTNYSIVPTMLSSTNYGYPTYLKARTATNFTGRRNDNNKIPCLWVAIGY